MNEIIIDFCWEAAEALEHGTPWEQIEKQFPRIEKKVLESGLTLKELYETFAGYLSDIGWESTSDYMRSKSKINSSPNTFWD